jgi:hypothetical protein
LQGLKVRKLEHAGGQRYKFPSLVRGLKVVARLVIRHTGYEFPSFVRGLKMLRRDRLWFASYEFSSLEGVERTRWAQLRLPMTQVPLGCEGVERITRCSLIILFHTVP